MHICDSELFGCGLVESFDACTAAVSLFLLSLMHVFHPFWCAILFLFFYYYFFVDNLTCITNLGCNLRCHIYPRYDE